MDLLYDLAGAIYRFMQAGPGFPVSLVFLVIVAVPVTLLHEVGHAIAARRLLGGDVQVSVGDAARIAELQLGAISISANALAHPGRAAGRAEFDGSHATARDVLMIALAGPAASLAGAVLTGFVLSGLEPTDALHDLMWAATLAGVFGVLNVVPLTLHERREGPPLKTDGRLALDALRVVLDTR